MLLTSLDLECLILQWTYFIDDIYKKYLGLFLKKLINGSGSKFEQTATSSFASYKKVILYQPRFENS